MPAPPQNVFVPRSGVTTDQGHLSFDEVCDQLAGAVGRLTGDDAKAVEVLGATGNDSVREGAATIDDLASSAGGRLVLDSRLVGHPAYPAAVVAAPGRVAG